VSTIEVRQADITKLERIVFAVFGEQAHEAFDRAVESE
jgi:hypothetical protein